MGGGHRKKVFLHRITEPDRPVPERYLECGHFCDTQKVGVTDFCCEEANLHNEYRDTVYGQVLRVREPRKRCAGKASDLNREMDGEAAKYNTESRSMIGCLPHNARSSRMMVACKGKQTDDPSSSETAFRKP